MRYPPTRRSFLPVSKLLDGLYGSVLAYPNPTRRLQRSRILEIERLGINSISFSGSVRLGKIDVLGKGYSAVVVIVRHRGKTRALKIRRKDASMGSLVLEAKVTKAANQVKVGPKLLAHSKNLLLMEYVKGPSIGDWVLDAKVKEITGHLRTILDDCYKLDVIGLDHGQLSNITEHVIIGKRATLVDFGKSSMNRRVSNVTSATQALFIGSHVARKIRTKKNLPTKNTIIKMLRAYKQDSDRKSFDELVSVLQL